MGTAFCQKRHLHSQLLVQVLSNILSQRHATNPVRQGQHNGTANDDGTSYLARGSNVVLQHGLERCEHRDTACVGATDGAFTVLETQAKDGRVDILRLRASTSHTATHMQ